MGIPLPDCNEFVDNIFVKDYDYAEIVDLCKYLLNRTVTLLFLSHLTNVQSMWMNLQDCGIQQAAGISE